MSRMSRIISSLSRVIPCLPHSFLPSFAGVDYSFIRSLTLSPSPSLFHSLPFLPFIPLATMI